MALTVAGAQVQGLAQLAGVTGSGPVDAKAVFESLCTKFRIDEKISKFLTDDCGCENLEDFAGLLTDEAQVEARITDKITGLERSGLQASRVRQAWHAVQAAMRSAEREAAKPPPGDDPNVLLPAPRLKELSDHFWQRYHIFYGVKIEPSD